jgi:CheY-like chemotaxis protein
MDVQMPGMDGLEAMRYLRTQANLSQVPIIALTALVMPGDRERCLQAGATDYLAKPLQIEELTAMLRRLLSNQSLS